MTFSIHNFFTMSPYIYDDTKKTEITCKKNAGFYKESAQKAALKKITSKLTEPFIFHGKKFAL